MVTGSQLRILRKFKDLKQDYVAKKAGVCQSTYSEWEISKEIKGERLQQLLQILELTEAQAMEILNYLPPQNQ